MNRVDWSTKEKLAEFIRRSHLVKLEYPQQIWLENYSSGKCKELMFKLTECPINGTFRTVFVISPEILVVEILEVCELKPPRMDLQIDSYSTAIDDRQNPEYVRLVRWLHELAGATGYYVVRAGLASNVTQAIIFTRNSA